MVDTKATEQLLAKLLQVHSSLNHNQIISKTSHQTYLSLNEGFELPEENCPFEILGTPSLSSEHVYLKFWEHHHCPVSMLETHLWSCENSFYTSKCWQWPDNRKLSMNTLPSFTLTMGFPTHPHCAGLRGDSICTDTELATVKIEKVEIQAHDSMCTAGTRQWIPMRIFFDWTM